MATAKQIAARKKWQAAGAASRRGKKAIDRVAHINYGPVHNTTRLVGSRGNVSVSIMADTDNRGRHWRVKYTKMVPNNVNGRPVPITGFGGAFTNSRQARQSAKGLLDLMTREVTIENTTTCKSSLNVAGEHFSCELDKPHDGLAHSNKKAQAIWL